MCLLEGWRSQQLNVSDEANTSFAHYRGEVGMLHRLVGRDPLLMICNSAESKPRKSKGKCPIQRRQQRQRPLKNTRNCNLKLRCKTEGGSGPFFTKPQGRLHFSYIYLPTVTTNHIEGTCPVGPRPRAWASAGCLWTQMNSSCAHNRGPQSLEFHSSRAK